MGKEKATFQQAMEETIFWCNAWESEELSDEVFADKISGLLNYYNGLRGFFAITLSSDCPILDRLPDPLLIQLREGGENVVDIVTKNLAMSTAMSEKHKRDNKEDLQVGSERVSIRCIEILRLLEPNSVKRRLEKLLDGVQGKGSDVDFLNRWGYDDKQINAIKLAVESIPEY